MCWILTPLNRRKTPKYPREKCKDKRCGQCGAPNWTRQHTCPARTAECRNCNRKGNFKGCADSQRDYNMLNSTAVAFHVTLANHQYLNNISKVQRSGEAVAGSAAEMLNSEAASMGAHSTKFQSSLCQA